MRVKCAKCNSRFGIDEVVTIHSIYKKPQQETWKSLCKDCNDKFYRKGFYLTDDERTVILFALHHLSKEIESFADKRVEWGHAFIRARDVEQLQEYMRYG
jgi:5-methylcytosine-specific restriction endonuclease McrA